MTSWPSAGFVGMQMFGMASGLLNAFKNQNQIQQQKDRSFSDGIGLIPSPVKPPQS